jgi:hypothetical protein
MEEAKDHRCEDRKNMTQCVHCLKLFQQGTPHDCEVKNEAFKKGKKFDGCGDDKSEMKLRYDLIPYSCIQELAKVYTYGAKKYSDNTWQKVEDFDNRYWSALQRHLVAWREGEVCDQESGLRHLSHALWNVVALLWNELTK